MEEYIREASQTGYVNKRLGLNEINLIAIELEENNVILQLYHLVIFWTTYSKLSYYNNVGSLLVNVSAATCTGRSEYVNVGELYTIRDTRVKTIILICEQLELYRESYNTYYYCSQYFIYLIDIPLWLLRRPLLDDNPLNASGDVTLDG
uniref:Uncharacterized protein n=1 Tax=Phaseolus vulgaris TaxID=3885 RepID=V7CQM0_PHAVU|nr:hypothetical protein PHAVU_002G328200g [Phaseolus vulgaris]ESW32507.1 hypothetical protein PHAVU_002G328200g [Phaseolus vulgaris]